jgi:hypothetical protein
MPPSVGAEALTKLVAVRPSYVPPYSPPISAPAPSITINAGVDISRHAVEVVRRVLVDARLGSATITSGRRSVQAQASIMYRNLVAFGVTRQRELYASSGDRVIDTYEAEKRAGKSAEAIMSAMAATIRAVGPTRVSNHLNERCEAVDVATSSISNGTAFVAALERAKQAGEIEGYHVEGAGMAYHLDVVPEGS